MKLETKAIIKRQGSSLLRQERTVFDVSLKFLHDSLHKKAFCRPYKIVRVEAGTDKTVGVN